MESKTGEPSDLSDVILNDNVEFDAQDCKSLKRPKRILHFSDGDLEEYSEDETDIPDVNTVVNQIDPKTLNWLPWARYQTSWIGSKVLNGCDYAGEWLASFFGITAPKYQFEINEFYRQKAVENDMRCKQDLEMAGWNEQNQNNFVNTIQ